ncbi:MAG: hypothetical protein ACRC68_12535 [Clostridium sp.]
MNNELYINLKNDKKIIKSAKIKAKTFQHQLILNAINKGTMPLYIKSIDFCDNDSILLSQAIIKNCEDKIKNILLTWDLEIGEVKINFLQ